MKILFLTFLISITGIIHAQEMIYGRVVTKADSLAVEGASVLIKGSDVATMTNRTGYFTISSTDKQVTVVVSHIGYHSESIRVNLPLTDTLFIMLDKNEHALQEVSVSSGYQVLSKERATGSYEHIGNELINRSVGTDIVSRLENVTNSLLFDKRNKDRTKLRIRGISTLAASPEPLVIVDNFPYEGDINNINPNDVEDVTVLKDAAAASIWGARAGNGVIVITTKAGKYKQPMKISFNSNLTVSSKPDLFELPEMSSADFIDVQRYLFSKGFYDADINNIVTYPPLGEAVELLEKNRSGLISEKEMETGLQVLGQRDVRHDFEKYLYQTAYNQQYSVNLSRGSDNMHYLFSAGYDKNRPNLVGNEYERISLRFANTLKPIRNFELSTDISYTLNNSKSNSIGAYGRGYKVSSIGLNMFPFTRFTNDQGEAVSMERYFRRSFTDTVGAGRLLDWRYSPLDEMKLADNSSMGKDLRINLAAKYRFSQSINGEIRYQYGNYALKGRNYRNGETFYSRDMVNRFSNIENGKVTYNLPMGGILDESLSDLNAHSMRAQLNYDKSWREHDVVAIIGGEMRQTRTEGNSNRLYGYNDALLTFMPVDYLTSFPTYNSMFGNSRIENPTSLSSQLDRFVSVYMNGAYTYRNRYTLSASARKDASNLFGVETNRKGVPLWSTGASWILSEENFYRVGIIPFLKVRFTYGYSGNLPSDMSAYTIITHSPATSNGDIVLPYASITTPKNPTLRWEKVGMMNLGVDFSLRNNRVSGSLEYYEKNVKDMLGSETMDFTKGFYSMITNSASMKGKGVDATISSINLTGAFRWQSNFIFSYVQNKLTDYLLEPNAYAKRYIGGGSTILPIEGKMPYMLVSYKDAGLDPANGDPRGILEGEASADYLNIMNKTFLEDAVYHGSPTPLAFGALRNTFGWRDFHLSFNIAYKANYYFRRNSINYNALYSNNLGHSDFTKRWQKQGDEVKTSVPSMVYPANRNRDNFYTNSEITVEKGDHVRIQDIQLSYSLKNLELTPFKNIQFYAYANNLNILLWKANNEGIDPEFIDGLKTPLSVSMGIKVDF